MNAQGGQEALSGGLQNLIPWPTSRSMNLSPAIPALSPRSAPEFFLFPKSFSGFWRFFDWSWALALDAWFLVVFEIDLQEIQPVYCRFTRFFFTGRHMLYAKKPTCPSWFRRDIMHHLYVSELVGTVKPLGDQLETSQCAFSRLLGEILVLYTPEAALVRNPIGSYIGPP